MAVYDYRESSAGAWKAPRGNPKVARRRSHAPVASARAWPGPRAPLRPGGALMGPCPAYHRRAMATRRLLIPLSCARGRQPAEREPPSSAGKAAAGPRPAPAAAKACLGSGRGSGGHAGRPPVRRHLSETAPQPARPSVAAPPAPGVASSPQAAVAQAEAVSWIASQVNSAAVIGCYPAMCASLQEQGVSASRLVPLGSGMSGILGTNVIVDSPPPSTKARRIGTPPRLSRASVLAAPDRGPRGDAGRGSGLSVRPAHRSAAPARARALSCSGTRASDSAPPTPRRLAAGTVDSRLLATLAALSSQFKLRVTGVRRLLPRRAAVLTGRSLLPVTAAGTAQPCSRRREPR